MCMFVYRFGENKGSFCTLASFSDKESSGSSSGSEDSLSEDSLKEPPSPLSTPVKQPNQVCICFYILVMK